MPFIHTSILSAENPIQITRGKDLNNRDEHCTVPVCQKHMVLNTTD